MSSNPYFTLVKIADISYINVVWFAIGYVVGYWLDIAFQKLYGTEYTKKSRWTLIAEVVSQIAAVGIIIYIGRNTGQFIPSPLDGIAGLDHYKVKELTNGAMLGIYVMLFQYSLQDKLLAIKNMAIKK